ncbi:hypothetical protein ABPG75_006590 [Micractinium tetrahymenae]
MRRVNTARAVLQSGGAASCRQTGAARPHKHPCPTPPCAPPQSQDVEQRMAAMERRLDSLERRTTDKQGTAAPPIWLRVLEGIRMLAQSAALSVLSLLLWSLFRAR